jgi:hypothetical protein
VLVGVMPKTYDYWQEVKQEINKLISYDNTTTIERMGL